MNDLVTINPAQLATIAIDRDNPSLDVLRELFELQVSYEKREAEKAFYKAKTAFMAEVPPIYKTAKAHNSTYTPLPEILEIIKPVLGKHGLSVSWRTEQNDGAIKVTCTLSHVDGHSENNSLAAGADTSGSKNDIQAIGSSQSYLMRYTLSGLLAISAMTPPDNDGNWSAGNITDEQRDELQTLIDETKTDAAELCKKFGINSLPELPKDKFGAAHAALTMKKKRAKK